MKSLVLILTFLFSTAAWAAEYPGLKQLPLGSTPLEGLTGREMLVTRIELEPGAASGKHYHPQNEFIYILEGTLTIDFYGEGKKPSVTGKTGDLLKVEPGIHHGARNTGKVPARLLVFGVTYKDKPRRVDVK